MPFPWMVGSNASRQIKTKVQPQLTGAHARLSFQVLGIVNHALREHRPNRDLATARSLLREAKPWYILTGRCFSRRTAVSKEATEVRVGGKRRFSPPAPPVPDGVQEARGHKAAGGYRKQLQGGAKLDLASSACRHAERVKTVTTRIRQSRARQGNARKRGPRCW